MRVSIRPYLQSWVDEIGIQLGSDDPTETVNHLLREYKRLISGQQPINNDQKSATGSDLAEILNSEFEF